MDEIVVTGAREHNLKGIRVAIPRGKLVVFTGVSGSGKSSLAFDTLYAEGQRRYVESLSAYARQFLGQMERPRYETVRGLSPTIAISQRTSGGSNPRSTVATVTEILDYLRVLYARVGDPHCPGCGRGVSAQSAQQIVRAIEALGAQTTVTLLAPLVARRKGSHTKLLDDAIQEGYTRVVIDGAAVRLDELEPLDPKRPHTIDLVIDRIKIQTSATARLTDSVETALKAGQGVIKVQTRGGETRLMSEHLACPDCGISLPELTPQLFSFNSPIGMCGGCQGLGSKLEVDALKLVPDPTLSLRQGAVALWSNSEAIGVAEMLNALESTFGLDLDKPWKKLSAKHRSLIFDGSAGRELTIKWNRGRGSGEFRKTWEGLTNQVKRRFTDTQSDEVRSWLNRFFSEAPCDLCEGTRLNEVARAVLVSERSLTSVLSSRVEEASEFFNNLALEGARAVVAKEIMREVRSRLSFLMDVGLGYLTLDRASATLAGGEAQRIRLASQLGSELSGVLYVLDEPSIGLHPRDTARLVKTLIRLRDADNTVLVVEHEPTIIDAADHIVDFGPGAGRLGGEVVAKGTPDDIRAHKKSLTGAYLSGRECIEVPKHRRSGNSHELAIRGAALNNLKSLKAHFPLGTLIVVTGVSGAGKSSLVSGTLAPVVRKALARRGRVSADSGVKLEGLQHLDKLVVLDQKPIGQTPRSNPATYVKAFDSIRSLFTSLPESKAYGFKAGRFSFNVKGGRCEDCQGAGVRTVEMHFLPNLHVTCEACRGRRFNEATLRVRYKGKNIADVLELTVSEALQLFEHHGDVKRSLTTLEDVGLGYLALGQSSTTLSGGEAQRVKLSRELSRRATGMTLYVLDEPTTGLHFDDVRKLLDVLGQLVDAGNTVIVIEHNMEVIKCADHVIDMGPEGGAGGGHIVAQGTPEQVAKIKGSHTGRHLKRVLAGKA